MIKYYYQLPTKFRRANTFNFPTEIEANLAKYPHRNCSFFLFTFLYLMDFTSP